MDTLQPGREQESLRNEPEPPPLSGANNPCTNHSFSCPIPFLVRFQPKCRKLKRFLANRLFLKTFPKGASRKDGPGQGGGGQPKGDKKGQGRGVSEQKGRPFHLC